MPYFNFRLHQVASRWGLSDFLRAWWRLARQDRRWTPPDFARWRRALSTQRNPHLARLQPLFFHLEAIYRHNARPAFDLQQPLPSAASLERTVGTLLLLRDPRRQDGTAYFALLQCINKAECLAHLLDMVAEKLLDEGIFRVIGPVGLSPFLDTGLLQNEWQRFPPADTPYHPPYFPELVAQRLRPLSDSQLFTLPVPTTTPSLPEAATRFVPLEPARLARELLPLLQTAVAHPHFPPPDAQEATFLLNYLVQETLAGWLAQIDGKAVGFVLLQPDFGARRRRAAGGRNLLWRGWLAATRPLATSRGLLRYGGVLPEWRGQGVGRGLLSMALLTARQRGWQELNVGPVAAGSTAASLLQVYEGIPGQRYQLYEWTP